MIYYKEGNFLNLQERKEPPFSEVPYNRDEQVNLESKTNYSGQVITEAILGLTKFTFNHMIKKTVSSVQDFQLGQP